MEQNAVTEPPISNRVARDGYGVPGGVMERIDFTLAENSWQLQEMIDLLRQQTTLLTQLLQTITQNSNTLAEKQPVNSVNLQVLQPVERPSKVLQRALDWLSAHPERLNETSRNLAAE